MGCRPFDVSRDDAACQRQEVETARAVSQGVPIGGVAAQAVHAGGVGQVEFVNEKIRVQRRVSHQHGIVEGFGDVTIQARVSIMRIVEGNEQVLKEEEPIGASVESTLKQGNDAATEATPRGVGCGRTDRKEVDWALQILSGSEYVACVAVLR